MYTQGLAALSTWLRLEGKTMLFHNSRAFWSSVFLIGLTIHAGQRHVLAQSTSNNPRPEFWVTNGVIHAMAQTCNTLYLGGGFSYVGPNTGSFVSIDTADGQPNLSFPRVNGEVYAVVADGSGGYFIGGNFSAVDGIPRNNAAHILIGGSLDTNWNPNANNIVYALLLSGGTIYAGGAFTSIGGQTRNHIAALSSSSGLATGWNPNANGPVRVLTLAGETLYVGGFFQLIGGQSRLRIAALNVTNGLATSWNPNAVGGAVYALAVTEDTIFVGGDFSIIGGQPRNNIAALNASDGLATAWDPDANSGGSANDQVFTIMISGTTVYVGGQFTNIGGQARNRIAAINLSDGMATNWNPNADSDVNTLAVLGTTVYTGGQFTNIGGQVRNRIASLSVYDGMANGWNPHASSTVRALVVTGNAIFVGGSFHSVGGQTRNRIAALDVVSGRVTSWNPNANSDVRALAVSGGTVYAGGDFSGFSSIGGQTRNRIAALNASDGLATSWNPNANGSVVALAISGSMVYVGGYFTGSNSIGGQTRNRIAALQISNGLATSWNPNANNAVLALAVSGDTVYAGGSFTGSNSIGGQARNRIAALDGSGNALLNWNPNADQIVGALAVAGNSVYAGGQFSNIGGQSRSRIAALDLSDGLATNWNPNASHIVNAITVSGSTVYAGGQFSSIGGQTRNRIAALNLSDGLATTWNPNANGTANFGAVNALAVIEGAVIIGGYFETIGGLPRRGLAAFSTINIDWNGGSGLWGIASNWTPAEIPDNVNCETYDVRVAGATSSVLVNINPTINSLTLENGAAVNVDAGSLTFVTPVGVVNDGSVSVTNGFEIIAGSPMKIGGTMPVTLATGGLASNDPANVITLTTPVTGHGQITAALNNQSTIHANAPSQTLDISGSLSAFSDGAIQASNGGTLQINRSIGGAGSYVATDGTISIPGNGPTTVAGNSVNVHSGGQVGASGEALLDIIGHVTLDCNEGALLGCSPPILVMGGDSTLDIGGDLNLFGTVDVNIGSSTFVRLARHFNNLATSPATFRWESGRLSMDGIGVQTFELAGFDFGDSDPNGFTNNFAMGELRVEPGRTVHFVNAFDNIPGPGCEVLYVDSLFLGAGSTIVLNGCNVYYRRLADDGATITLLNGAELTSALIGDMTCDNEVNGGDIAAFILAITDPVGYEAAYPDCPINHADLNQSETVDLADVEGFVLLLLNGI